MYPHRHARLRAERSIVSTLDTVLIVDDDEAFSQALARALGRRQLQPFIVHDLDSVVQACAQQPFDYAVVDLRLGEESGLKAVAHLHGAQPAMSIVVLTGYASIATAVEAVKLGATHYLTKPAQPEDIVAALRRRPAGDPDAGIADKPMSVRRLEWEHLQNVLTRHDGNISAAARALGMHRRSLQRKLQKRPVRS